jgi:putative ATP-dependent endonuclease of the OLD family
MRIAKLKLTNFRCFGTTQASVTLSNLTALVGANGCGKSAVLSAMVRLFGVSQPERTLVRSDFHLPPGKDWDDIEEATLRIEAKLVFPKLGKAGKDVDPVSAAFKHMTIDAPGKSPYCRIRLDGTWNKSNLPEGDIEQKLVWVTSPYGTDEEDETLVPVLAHDRSRIHVHYVPASRDPSRQIRQVAGSFLHTLLRAVEWSPDTLKSMKEASDSISKAFGDEGGVQVVQTALETSWAELHGAPEHRKVAIRPVSRRVEDLIKQVETTFSPGPADKEDGIDRLSDGQRSLFYLSMVTALFDVQESVGTGADEDKISRDKLSPPVLNVLAVEEPENHVAPHYLGRIMGVLRRIAETSRGQVILSSHSPSMLSRVEPEDVRQLRTVLPERTTAVTAITLPEKKSEQYKYIREAVRAFPELYFAKFVVLGEGDSEEVVIPRLAEAMGVPIDASFVSVVPLGGRHVNHLWRLLDQLAIPCATLLDLDRERHGGGWGRIKYVLDQLIELGMPEAEALPDTIDAKKLAGMHKWDVKSENLAGWVKYLEKFNVYFSSPLDLDFSMLAAFPDEYQGTAEAGGGPEIPTDVATYKTALGEAVKAVLKENSAGGVTYDADQQKSFFWYRYLFLGRSKPSTHILALSSILDDELSENAPESLKRLVAKLKESLEVATPDEESRDAE